MSKKTPALISVIAVVGIVATAILLGVESGTFVFSAVGGILLLTALILFFTSKKD